MKILGIDPGTAVMGYGVVESHNDDITLVGFGAINAPAGAPMSERLSFIYNELLKVIRQYHPDALAAEQPFIAKNVRSAMAIGRAQAVALLAAAGEGIPTYEYTPAQVKQRVSSYGASSKEQIQEIIRLHLGLSDVPRSSDAADALAVAICHLTEIHLSNLLAGR